jgi:hypothetical protein
MRPDQTFFFVHIMKTGGYSLVHMIKSGVFGDDAAYPSPADRDVPFLPYLSLEYLRQVLPARRRHVRFFAGHFPFEVRALLGNDVRTFAFFRDPVERVISHLRYARFRNPQHRGMSLEAIYEDISEAYIRNLQLRTFAIRSLHDRKSVFEPIVYDEAALALASERVAELDVIGLVEDFEASTRMLAEAFSWRLGPIARDNESPSFPISDELRQRIEHDNEMDIRFYRTVATLYAERKAAL